MNHMSRLAAALVKISSVYRNEKTAGYHDESGKVHSWTSSDGTTYDVRKLWEISKDNPVEHVDFSRYVGPKTHQLLRNELGDVHERRVQEADLSYPLLVSHDNNRVDGSHRLAKAIREGRTKLPIQRLTAEQMSQAIMKKKIAAVIPHKQKVEEFHGSLEKDLSKTASAIELVDRFRDEARAQGYSFFAVAAKGKDGASVFRASGNGVAGNAARNARRAHMEFEVKHGIDPDHERTKTAALSKEQAKEQANLHYDTQDWGRFEKNLKAKRFQQAAVEHPESDQKLKKYIKNFGGYLTSKKVVGVVPSRTSSKMYKVKELPNGRLACNCKDWQYKHSVKASDCDHIKELKQGLIKQSSLALIGRGVAAHRAFDKSREIKRRGQIMNENVRRIYSGEPYIPLGGHH